MAEKNNVKVVFLGESGVGKSSLIIQDIYLFIN